jgi:hypothetical protein
LSAKCSSRTEYVALIHSIIDEAAMDIRAFCIYSGLGSSEHELGTDKPGSTLCTKAFSPIRYKKYRGGLRADGLYVSGRGDHRKVARHASYYTDSVMTAYRMPKTMLR